MVRLGYLSGIISLTNILHIFDLLCFGDLVIVSILTIQPVLGNEELR